MVAYFDNRKEKKGYRKIMNKDDMTPIGVICKERAIIKYERRFLQNERDTTLS